MFCSVEQTKTSEDFSNVCDLENSPWVRFLWVNKQMCSLTALQLQVQTEENGFPTQNSMVLIQQVGDLLLAGVLCSSPCT